MPALSYGLNITKKSTLPTARPPPAKRKTIFDDDSGPEDGSDKEDDSQAISTIGSLKPSSRTSSQPTNTTKMSGNSSKPPKISHFGDLSTTRSISKHAQDAQSIDPSIYDYDSVYDSLHSGPKSSASAADDVKKPKYMSNLLAAAEIRKRDQLRAKEKMLAKEREAEGDEFADKEKFVTAAYKRQQEEMRKAEAEEAIREKEAEERQRREGGGMKGFYKGMLEKGEKKHEEVMKKAEEAQEKGGVVDTALEEKEASKEKSEAQLAREKGAAVNEEGQVVDKRQLLNAGLNAGAAPKVKKAPPDINQETGTRRVGSREARKESARERETRLFEEQLLGKRDASDANSDENERASKSRKMEDDILAMIGRG
ncbi:MAG: hypothetical protein Q9190_008103 [Brigantiaea leucoxantha]